MPREPFGHRLFARWRAAVADQARMMAHLLRWVVLGAMSGVLAGIASYLFLKALEHVTDARVERDWIIWALPVAGIAVGFVYHRWGGRAGGGNSLLIEEIHEPTKWVPRRMAPLIFGGTIVSHLFGASVGREGAAIQMSGSLTDAVARHLPLTPSDRRLLLIAAIAGGFGSVFGVPLAGAVFALEVQAIGRVRYEALVPALTASIVGDLIVGGLGVKHARAPQLDLPTSGTLLLKVAVAGVVFGLVSTAFTAAIHAVKGLAERGLPWPPARLAIGGVATLGLVGLFGRDHLGLSLPLIDSALAGHDPGAWTWALKLLFTVVALGCGFPGGEVTPLFVIGATLGGALASPLGIDVGVLASIGFVSVFAGAANTPLACTIMGAELFGSGSVLAVSVGCVVAYVCSSHRGIYATQRLVAPKTNELIEGSPTVADWHARRRRPPVEPDEPLDQ